MKIKQAGRKTVNILLAFCGTYGISYLLNMRETTSFAFSIFSVPLMAIIWLELQKCEEKLEKLVDGKLKKRRILYAAFVGLVFGSLLVAGYQLQWFGYTEYGYLGKLKIVLRGLCIAIPVFPVANLFFEWIDKIQLQQPAMTKKPWRNWRVFLCCWLGIWLCWLPVWLAYYPVVMSYDFHRQSLEACLGPGYFLNHHPVAHTVLIWVFCKFGAVIGSYEVAMGCFSQLQQLIISAVLGYACVMIYRLTGKKCATVVGAILFALFPVISVFVMCSTKDVLFSAFFVLFILLFLERTLCKTRRTLMDVLWVLSGIVMMLFRNNAWYAMLLFAVVLVIFCGKKERLRTLLLCVLLLVGARAAKFGIEYAVHANAGGELEPYSVVIQCMARTGCLREADMTEDIYELIDTYVTNECWQDYNPVIVDSVKESVHARNRLEKKSWDNIGEVLCAWVKVGMKYPNEYLDAFLQLTRGYWFLDDTSHAEMLGVGVEEQMGLIYTYNSYEPGAFEFNYEPVSKFPWLKEKLEKLVSANCYYSFPVGSTLFKPAFWCWMLVLLAVAYSYGKQKEKLLTAAYPLCYFGTMLLGPTALIRYVFPILILIPVLLALLFYHRPESVSLGK